MAPYHSTSKSEIEFYLNHARRPARKDKFSKFFGVHKNGDPKKPYRVAIRFRGLKTWGGTFENEIDAARAYNELALKVIGPEAILNEIPE
jgi:hypothetical protein